MSTVVTPENEAVAPAVAEPAPAGRPLPLWYSSTVAGLVAVATVYGLVTRPYRLVPDMLATTWVAQDAVTLATAPLLVWAAVRAAKGALRAHVLWVGLQTWIAYCYAHLAIGAPLNSVFLVYVALLALAGYGMLDGIPRVDVTAAAPAFERAPRRGADVVPDRGGHRDRRPGSATSCLRCCAATCRPASTSASCPTPPGCSTWCGSTWPLS
jgi:hypothetical protein